MFQDLVTPKWFWHKSLGGGETGRGGGGEDSLSVYTVKKGYRFSRPHAARMTKLSLVGNNLIIPGQEDFCQ